MQGSSNDTLGGHLSGGSEEDRAKLLGQPVFELIFEPGTSRIPSRSDKHTRANWEDGKDREKKNTEKDQRR